MKWAVVLQHVPYEGPARLAGLLGERGYGLDLRRLDRGETVPKRLSSNEVLACTRAPSGVDRILPEPGVSAGVAHVRAAISL